MPHHSGKVLDNMTDEQLMKSFQAGDEDSYVLLVDRYKNRLINFIYRYTGNYDDAEDLVQDCLVKVYTSKHLYREIAKFSTWVHTIVLNLARTKIAKEKKVVMVSINNINTVSENEFDIPDGSWSPDINAESKIQNAYIQKALMQIPKEYRELVILRDVEDYSYEEIAEICELPMGTVKSRINRGREKLQELLKDIYNT